MGNENHFLGFCPKNDAAQSQGGAQPQASNTLTQGSKMKGAKAGSGRYEFLRGISERTDFIKPYIPNSWFHPIGAFKKRAEILPRLPNLRGSLFLTFTVDPKYFSGPSSAFDVSRKKLRKVFFALRKGILHLEKTFRIDAPYLTKVEFHKSGFAHFHVIFKTRSYLPPKVINRLWGLGRVNVKRIRTRGLEYLLKYVTKGENLPDWVKERKRIRITQPSRGFYLKTDSRETEGEKEQETGLSPEKTALDTTIGERIERWRRTAVLRIDGQYTTLVLARPFFEILAEIIYPIARSYRYLGNWVVQFDQISDLLDWELLN